MAVRMTVVSVEPRICDERRARPEGQRCGRAIMRRRKKRLRVELSRLHAGP
jgi:hypothetical protein